MFYLQKNPLKLKTLSTRDEYVPVTEYCASVHKSRSIDRFSYKTGRRHALVWHWMVHSVVASRRRVGEIPNHMVPPFHILLQLYYYASIDSYTSP